MRDKPVQNRGYIGLLLLLLGVALMAMLIVRSDLFSGKKDDKGMLEEDLQAVDKAQEAKNLLEQQNKQSVEE